MTLVLKDETSFFTVIQSRIVSWSFVFSEIRIKGISTKVKPGRGEKQ